MNTIKALHKHNRTLINWFKEIILGDDSASKTLRLLVVGPNLNVPTWKGYDINNYSLYTRSQDDKSTVQNSGVTVDAHLDHFSSASDNNPV